VLELSCVHDRYFPLLFKCPNCRQLLLRCQVLDMYFGNVCELDLIFNFHKAYYILDELLIAGGQQGQQQREKQQQQPEQQARSIAADQFTSTCGVIHEQLA
jgi:AP-1 complex subunit sigma 1/2